ncbi:MAG: pro-sigmaK processing inhibitor BofA family protein [Acutalibacteraceae bacterium]
MLVKIALSVLAAAFIANFVFAVKTKKPLRVLIWSGGIGLLSLAVLSISDYFFNVGLEFNLYTLVSSFLFGLPGVIAMLITKIIWIV